MILFYEKTVEQSDAMVVTTANPNCVFLCGAQRRQRLSSVKNFHFRMLYKPRVVTTRRRRRRKRLKNIERATFTSKNAARRPRQRGNDSAVLYLIAIANQPINSDTARRETDL